MAKQAAKSTAAGKKTTARKTKTSAAKGPLKANGSSTEQPTGRQPGMPIFYNQPEVLDSERHKGLELKPITTYEFTKNVNAIPITAAEFPSLARDYPIVFTTGDNPGAVAINAGLRTGHAQI